MAVRVVEPMRAFVALGRTARLSTEAASLAGRPSSRRAHDLASALSSSAEDLSFSLVSMSDILAMGF